MSVEDIVWEFDGGEGRLDVLMALVNQQLKVVDELLPKDTDDPLERLVSELPEGSVELLDANPVLARLFPPAMADPGEADQLRRAAVSQQAWARMDAGRAVLADCDAADAGIVPVRGEHIAAWVTTLAGLRAAWSVELTGSAERLVTASRANKRANPTAAAICDWLGWLQEDALQAHRFLL